MHDLLLDEFRVVIEQRRAEATRRKPVYAESRSVHCEPPATSPSRDTSPLSAGHAHAPRERPHRAHTPRRHDLSLAAGFSNAIQSTTTSLERSVQSNR
jgi:hypothetical protein